MVRGVRTADAVGSAEAEPTDPRARRATATLLAGAAWIGWAAACLMSAIGVLVWFAADLRPPPVVFEPGPLVLLVCFSLAPAFASIGLLLIRRRAGGAIGWLLLVWGLEWGVYAFALGRTARASAEGVGLLDPRAMALIGSVLSTPVGMFCAVSLGLRFPDGRLLAPPWRWVEWLALAGASLTGLAIAATPGPLFFWPTLSNPLVSTGSMGATLLATAGRTTGFGLVAVAGALAVDSVLIRYRRGDVATRHQLRWFMSAGALLVATFTGYFLAVTMGVDPAVGVAIAMAFWIAHLLLANAIAVAVLRYRLYDIDRILDRAFVYGGLTAILAGLYAASIRLFTSVFTTMTGEASDAALVLTTLVLATTFTPIKQRLERLARDHLPVDDEHATPGTAGGTAVAGGPLPGVDVEAVARTLAGDAAFVEAVSRGVAKRAGRRDRTPTGPRGRSGGRPTSPSRRTSGDRRR